jgi:hypothetical protein
MAPEHLRRIARILAALFVMTHCLATAPRTLAQDGGREIGMVVGTTGLNIRACPDVTCGSRGLAQLEDPVIVTGPPRDGYLPVEWAGKEGWAWQLYVATPSRGTPFLRKGTPGCNRVALIFNIGIGEPIQLHPLLWLKSENVPATLFPMRTLAMLGFPIGTHGDVRLNLTGFSDSEVVADIRDSATHIRQVIGRDPVPYFTPYAADMDERVRNLAARQGYLPVGWDVPADDWRDDITAEYVYDRVVPNVEDGSIVEFHIDGPASAESTAVAIPWIVETLRERGFQFVTIPDMAQPCGAATPVPSTPVSATPVTGTPPAR